MSHLNSVVIVAVTVDVAIAFRRHSAAAVVVAGLSAVVPGATAGTVASVTGLSMLGTRLACFDPMGMVSGHVESQTTAAVGKG